MNDVNGSAAIGPEMAKKAREKARRKMVKRENDQAGLPPAGQVAPHGGVERTEFFGGLKIPMTNGTGKP